MLSASPAMSDSPVLRGSLRQQVLSRILAGVFQGRFPSGQRLVVQQLAALYGVSPTPVREALVELAGLSVVDLIPNRGAVVLPFGAQQVREISHVRRVLEVEAARCACGRADPEALAALVDEQTQLMHRPRDAQWDRDTRASDTRLHDLIAESCGSARLRAEIDRYLTLIRAVRDVSRQRDARTHYARTDDAPEHLAILQALQVGDADGAAQAMDRHVRSVARTLEAVMFPAPARPRTTARKAPPTALD